MKKNLYKIIVAITLLVPLPLYLFLSATLFNINADVTFKNADSEDLIINESYVYTNKENVIHSGIFTYEDDKFMFYYDDDTIIKVDDGYFGIENNELKDVKRLIIQKETSYKVPIAFIVSVLGVSIVALMVTKKMQWHKQYPRLATFIALLTTTLILYVINILVSNILYVFLIATISWSMYCVEYLIHNNIISEKEAVKADSSLLAMLKEGIKK